MSGGDVGAEEVVGSMITKLIRRGEFRCRIVEADEAAAVLLGEWEIVGADGRDVVAAGGAGHLRSYADEAVITM